MTVNPMLEVPRMDEFKVKSESRILGKGKWERKLAFTEYSLGLRRGKSSGDGGVQWPHITTCIM